VCTGLSHNMVVSIATIQGAHQYRKYVMFLISENMSNLVSFDTINGAFLENAICSRVSPVRSIVSDIWPFKDLTFTNGQFDLIQS
jgi:hypothetical protein